VKDLTDENLILRKELKMNISFKKLSKLAKGSTSVPFREMAFSAFQTKIEELKVQLAQMESNYLFSKRILYETLAVKLMYETIIKKGLSKVPIRDTLLKLVNKVTLSSQKNPGNPLDEV
jgi:hypothetical protein